MSEPAQRPERPLLPTTLWALLASIAVMRLALRSDAEPLLLVSLAATILAAGLILALLAARPSRKGGWAAAATAVASCVALASLACAHELDRQGRLAAALSSSPVSAWELSVESDMSEGAAGWRGRASVRRAGEDGAAGEVWLLANDPMELGSRVRCVGRFSPNENDEWGASSRAQGLCGTIRVVAVTELREPEGAWGAVLRMRSEVLDRLDAASSDGRALVAGAVCGSTGGMARRGLDDLFAACGISHLVAVSGGHLVLVCAVAGALLSRLPMRPLARTTLLLVLTGAFVVFCGAPDSAVRSWVMALVAGLSGVFGRRAHPLSSAALVGLVMALVEPGVTGRLGYLLSVASVCGICALGPYVRYALEVLFSLGASETEGSGILRSVRRVRGPVLEALSMTLVSQVVTAPLTCSTFGTLSLVAPLANVLLGPIFSVLLVLGMLVVVLSFAPGPQGMIIGLCELISSPLVAVARALAALPGACVNLSVEEGPALAALALALALLLVLWPRLTRARLLVPAALVASVALCLFLRWRFFAPACVRVLDVGQADAILVTDGGSSVLVDTGLNEGVLEALARNHVVHLDAIVLTHLHDDHVGGLDAVLKTYGTERVYVAEGVSVDAGGAEVSGLSVGDALRIGRFSLTVVSPRLPVDGSENEDSLVMRLLFDDGARTLTGLLTGDAEAEVVGEAAREGLVGDVDLLKVGHHGSEASVTSELAGVLEPEVSVASAGEGNSYGHPDPLCVETLEGCGSVFLCTKDVGDVCVEPGVEGPVVSCQRGTPVDDRLGEVDDQSSPP